MSSIPTWAVVSTIKAPAAQILDFAAYHLDLGAHHIFVCLDDDNPDAQAVLDAHPKCTAIRTDRAWWKETAGFVPKKHQVRQVQNASRIYRDMQGIDWLVHIDVDEFLCPEGDVAGILAALPDQVNVARVSPFESLCVESTEGLEPGVTYCKARLPGGAEGQKIEREIYPTFGGLFRAGFISHTAGKIFVRAGHAPIKFAIHRAFKVEAELQEIAPLPAIDLCHRHVESWDKWLKIMRFRLEKGSYREELAQRLDPSTGRVAHHTLFSTLTEDGTDELRSFFEEMCLATPQHLEQLAQHGLLRRYVLDIEAKRRKHFPDFRA